METQEQVNAEHDDTSDEFDWEAALDRMQGREPPEHRNVMSLSEFAELTKS